MSELFFTAKCLVISLLIIFSMQVKVGHATVENYFNDWLQTSPMCLYLQEVSSGGVLFMQNTYQNSKRLFESKLNTNNSTQKASRLDLEIKRNNEK